MAALIEQQSAEGGLFQTELHPAVTEALSRLNYAPGTARLIVQHIAGTHSLRNSQGINAAALRAAGLGDAQIEKVEAYIPNVNDIRLALTPWIIGVGYCCDKLGVTLADLECLTFDLAGHLGFDAEDIAAANAALFGFGTVRNCKVLQLRHRPMFACGLEVSADARIRMAAAVQSFITEDTGITAPLPTARSVARGADTVLSAWRCGLKSLTVFFDSAVAAKPVREVDSPIRRIKASPQPHAKPLSAIAKPVVKGEVKSVAPRTSKGGTEKRPRG
jgi:ribonucleoside-diphosphate reductase alpha chain